MDAYPPLTAFVPHRPPMLLLERLLSHDETHAVCEARIRPDWIFVEDGGVSALVALELFAQTAAAHVGYLGYVAGGTMASGALLGTRRLDLAVDRYEVGDVLEVRVEQVMSMPPAAQYDCALLRGGEVIASGTINVAIGVGVRER
jgi:predicted hotdog family 3-hydroxylacyl-ACP dehydratase